MSALVSRMTHSLMTRLALLVLVLVGLIAAVLFISWIVFQAIDERMASLSSERMPELRANAHVIAATDATRAILTSSLIAQDADALEKQSQRAATVFADFRAALDQLSPEASDLMRPTLNQAETAVNELLKARSAEFTEFAGMMATIQAASENAEAASALIEEANDSAFFDMTLSGEDTIETIDTTLTRLVDVNFSQFQTALSIRGDINLIAGLAIAFSQDSNSQIASIIADLANSANNRLVTALDQNKDTPVFEDAMPVLRNAVETFQAVFDGGFLAPTTSDILAARLAVDSVLSPAIDDIYFDLIIANDDAKETNRAALLRLLEQDVEGMRQNGSLDTVTKYYFAVLLQVASAGSEAELDLRQGELLALANDIKRIKTGTEFDAHVNLTELLNLADPETGIAAQRLAMFAAQKAAFGATNVATEAVNAIAQEAALFSERVIAKIEDSAGFLAVSVEDARAQLVNIAYVTFAIVLVVPVLLWYFVTRPIAQVTLVTERLSKGDLSEITGLSRNQGELGRMASALHVFRDSALKNIEMQEEERRRERAALEAEKQAEMARLAQERRQAAERAARQEAERDRDAKLAAAEEARQKKEMADRTARMEEQNFVVSTLAQGLNSLASGDLTSEINNVFPDAYEALRLDFNAAIKNLAQIVHQLKQSTETIEGNCSEIASASDDLAIRTESNAATLADTVVSVGSLSSSVAEAAQNAGEASATLQGIREQAKLNNDIMQQAQAAMGRVEEASEKITSIVDIIDSVAFQTNLLALNAGVEAARAGDAGQGFAVVANEVRTLAQRCGEAASDIGAVVEESTNTVQEGVDLTEKANQAMAMIDNGIDQISEIVEGMAAASFEQANGLQGVNQAIQDLDRSTQQNAAMFEETSASNHVLTSEALALSKVVRSFIVDDPNADGAHDREIDLAS